MANYKDLFKTEESQNWFRCTLALHITREGILEFVDDEIKTLHHRILKTLPVGSICTSCVTQSVVPCPAKKVCKIGRDGKCLNFHNVPPTGCPKRVCDRIVREIELVHKYNGPSWKNTDASKWCTSPWELAKCFCPPDGYAKIFSPQDTDLNGLISVMQNCSHFQFRSSTADTVLEKARDVCRKVRHCPGLKIDLPTTTEYINELIDLLNEIKFPNHFSKAAVRKSDLEKLKHDTLPVSNTEVQTIVKDVYEQSKQDLRDDINTVTLVCKNKLESLTQVLQQVNSKFTDLEKTMDVRVGAMEKTVSDHCQRILQLESSKILPNYEALKAALQMDLLQYYKIKRGAVLFSSARFDLEEDLHEFYVEPTMNVVRARKTISKNSKEIKGNDVLAYEDLFKVGDVRNIYIQGNAGMGKSSFCTKLTLDWCSFVGRDSQDTEAKKKNTGLDFDFLFQISLRESNGKVCEVYQMIKKSIINQLSFRQKYNDDFLSEILDTERCLIILDGLDEWTHSENGSCEMPLQCVPHRSALGKCVYLTLSRPWKLNETCLKDADIDLLLEISGVKDPKALIINVVRQLNSNKEKPMDAEQLFAATQHLSSLTAIPIISIQLVCVWYENEAPLSSDCSIFCEILKMILEREKVNKWQSNKSLAVDKSQLPKCFHSIKWSERETHFLIHLARLAFETLFPEDGRFPQVVFSDDIVNRYLEEQSKLLAFSVCILTECRLCSLNQRSSQLSFLHKTFQEFLAALFLALQTDQSEDLLSRLKTQDENTAEIANIFIFLCGMAPSLATSVSKILMTATTYLLKINRQECTVKNITEILRKGYIECVQNEHDNIYLEMIHVYFGRDRNKIYQPEEELLRKNLKKIETIWCASNEVYQTALGILKSCSKTLKTLYLPFVDESVDLTKCSSLQAITIPDNDDDIPAVYLDLSKCEQLEYLDINQPNLAVNINSDLLCTCKLCYYDLSKCNIVETITKRNSKLQNLVLNHCKISKLDGGLSRNFHLDITSCSSLKKLKIRFCDTMSVSINTTSLQKCHLWYNIDLSQGNLIEALSNSTKLTELELVDGCFPETDTRHDKMVCIEMSACTNLSYVNVYSSDVIIKCK